MIILVFTLYCRTNRSDLSVKVAAVILEGTICFYSLNVFHQSCKKASQRYSGTSLPPAGDFTTPLPSSSCGRKTPASNMEAACEYQAQISKHEPDLQPDGARWRVKTWEYNLLLLVAQ